MQGETTAVSFNGGFIVREIDWVQLAVQNGHLGVYIQGVGWDQ